MRVALFDFDGTVYKKETFKILMKHLKAHPIYGKQYNRFFLSMLPSYLAYKLKIQSESVMKENSMRHYLAAFKHIPVSKLQFFFNEVAKELKHDLNLDVIERLEKHQASGDLVMLVSSAFTPLLEQIKKEANLPIDMIIGTQIPIKNEQVDQIHTMRHIQGKRKIEEIHKALTNQQIDWKNSYAYGDSYSDLPMLELVGHPVSVQPDQKLKTVATTHKWEII